MALVLGEGAPDLGASRRASSCTASGTKARTGERSTEVLRRHRPHVLLIPATAWGRDVGPRAAGELELGMTGDCVGVDIAKAGRLLQQKPAYGGNIVSVIMGATTPQLATVRPRMYEPLEPRDAQAEERVETLGLPVSPIRLLERRPYERPGLDVRGGATSSSRARTTRCTCASACSGGRSRRGYSSRSGSRERSTS